MKKTLFTIIWVFLAFGAFAQITQTANFQLIFPNKTDKSVFAANRKIKSYLIRYKENKPANISIYYFKIDKQAWGEDEFYDLMYEGDLYRWKKRYGQIDLPEYPTVNMLFPIAKLDSTGSKYDHQVDVSIDKDYIIYDLKVDHLQGKIYEMKMPIAFYPRDNKQLHKDIIAEFNHSVPLQDTVFIFQGIVNRNGTMTGVELVEGPSSSFTESIRKWLQEPENLWQPQLQGGRPVRSLVDIFIRIRDGQILSVSSSGWNRKKISP